MRNLRGVNDSSAATDKLSRVTVATRAERIVTGEHGIVGYVSAASSAAVARDNTDDLDEQAANTARSTTTAPAKKATAKAAAVTAKTTRRGILGRGAPATVRRQRTAATVKSGIFGRPTTVGSAVVDPTATVGQITGTSSSPAQLALGRVGSYAIQATRAAIAALVSALSGTPALAIAVVVIGLIMVIVATAGWFLPGVQQDQQSHNGSILAGSFPIGDDYPFKGMGHTSVDPRSGYYYGNCTDFVWWRINRDAGVTAEEIKAGKAKYTHADLTPLGGNGYQWGQAGNLPGWETTKTPVPGDIISVSKAGVLGISTSVPGHVGYVGAVDEAGNVVIENYDGNTGNYFLLTSTVAQLDRWVDGGGLVIKHNPAGRVGGLPNGDADGDAKSYALQALGNDTDQYHCLDLLWTHESNWNPEAENPSSGAFGIPQALPASKMAAAGADYRTNGITQVKWGLNYISSRYGTACAAWAFWQSNSPHWY